ncbi:MAG: tripartite tricarboxylate transporter substrate-binding protein, partial [Phycisphaerales bacterium]|nr:tripartite tricarboxylate transporter substrate-binding protein [Phycisphaerales bacterium]
MQSNIRRMWGAAVLVALMVLPFGWTPAARAQEKYPTRGIDIIAPFAPGGATDVAARATAAYLSKKFRVPVNVINKPGARGIPQTLEIYRAAPDGYTLVEDGGTTTTFLAAAMGKDLPFNIFDRTFLG